jgi:hypothetical protein
MVGIELGRAATERKQRREKNYPSVCHGFVSGQIGQGRSIFGKV